MIVFQGAQLVTHQINVKDGGFTLTIDVPESAAKQLSQLIEKRKYAFDLYFDAYGSEDDPIEITEEILDALNEEDE